MSVPIQTCDQLRGKKCVPCEGGVPKLTSAEAEAQIKHLTGWELTSNHERLTFRFGGRDFRLTDVHGNVPREILA